MIDTLIVGAGGHGKVVLDILRAAGQHRPVGFLDADPKLANTTCGGLPVLGPIAMLNRLRHQHRIGAMIVAIGNNRARTSYIETIRQQGVDLINAIHPSAVVSASATLGKNVVIAAGAVICTEAKLADGVIINTAATVDHECELSAAVHVCPGAHLAGRVRVGERATIGLGANVIQCLRIEADAFVGAGAVVIRDVPEGVTVAGVPARILRRRA